MSGQFQRHFLILGFKGGAIGGGAAILLFAIVEAANSWLTGTPGGDEIAGLFGFLSIGVAGYLAILLQIVFMALVTAFASRHTVNRTLADYRLKNFGVDWPAMGLRAGISSVKWVGSKPEICVGDARGDAQP